MILAGDIGGTHTRLALFDDEGNYRDLQIYPSGSYPNLESIIQEYLAGKKGLSIEVGCFAVAGPVYEGVCRVTNLPWLVDSRMIGDAFSFPQVYLLNDLEANAYSVQVLPEDSLQALYGANIKKEGNRAVVSPGTGLGEAGIYWDGMTYHPFACEGGHVDFAPVGELQVELYKYLQSQYDHVSYEIPLSGPGLSHIYQFLLEAKKRHEEPFLKELKQTQDLSVLVTTHGMNKTSDICREALDIFCDLLAQESANMALKLLAYGGVYLGGGIVPRILSKLMEPRFLDRYFHKGTFRDVLEKIPLIAITDDKAALKGSAYFAATKVVDKSIKSLL